MTYRPYPNAERALRQLDRHYPPAPVVPAPRRIPMSGTILAAMRRHQQAAGQGLGAGTYVLSTRPGIVGGSP